MKKYTELVEEFDEEPTSEKTPTDIVVVDSNDLIKQAAEELTTAIAKAQTKEELEALYQQFHINNTKKNALRINQLNDLLDQVNKEAIERFTRRPGEMTNKEVLDYMTAVQNQIERSQKTVEGIKDITAIQVNNTQNNTVNIHVGNEEITSMSKDSRDRITDLIATILKENNKNIVLDMSEDQSSSEKTTVVDAEINNPDNPEDDDFAGDD